jgi:hypothetical protein
MTLTSEPVVPAHPARRRRQPEGGVPAGQVFHPKETDPRVEGSHKRRCLHQVVPEVGASPPVRRDGHQGQTVGGLQRPEMHSDLFGSSACRQGESL